MRMILELLTSKKFVAALLAVLAAVAAKMGAPEATVGELTAIVSPLLAFIGAQGLADIGKERVQEEVKWMREKGGGAQ